MTAIGRAISKTAGRAESAQVPPPPAEVMAAWDEACQIAFETGQEPVINLPRGLIDSRIKSLRNVMTGQWVDINWLPPDRFPSDLPAQYFNPDLILREGA
jgi:hypothetical protein